MEPFNMRSNTWNWTQW